MVDLTKWIPGVTPTTITCPHKVIIARGVYGSEMIATGDHDGCWTQYLEDEYIQEELWWEDMWRSYYQ